VKEYKNGEVPLNPLASNLLIQILLSSDTETFKQSGFPSTYYPIPELERRNHH
jgi:hypothetical protein